MNVTNLQPESDGTASIEIRCNEISHRALLRCLRNIQGAVVTDTAHNPMTDDARAKIFYKGLLFKLETPFSDYEISCATSSETFEEFVAKLKAYRVRWWDKLF